MKLQLTRTYFPKGVMGELYHRNTLEMHWLEISPNKSHTFLYNMPDGTYLLGKHAGGGPEWALRLTMPHTSRRLTLCLHDVITRPLTGCPEPFCFATGDGKVYMADAAKDRLALLFNNAIAGKEKIILKIETACEVG